jgi:hypothetical protein
MSGGAKKPKGGNVKLKSAEKVEETLTELKGVKPPKTTPEGTVVVPVKPREPRTRIEWGSSAGKTTSQKFPVGTPEWGAFRAELEAIKTTEKGEELAIQLSRAPGNPHVEVRIDPNTTKADLIVHLREGGTVHEKIHEFQHVELVRKHGLKDYELLAKWQKEQWVLNRVMESAEWKSGFKVISKEEKIDAVKYLIGIMEKEVGKTPVPNNVIEHYKAMLSQLESLQ